jgi:hypothetical protein
MGLCPIYQTVETVMMGQAMHHFGVVRTPLDQGGGFTEYRIAVFAKLIDTLLSICPGLLDIPSLESPRSISDFSGIPLSVIATSVFTSF